MSTILDMSQQEIDEWMEILDSRFRNHAEQLLEIFYRIDHGEIAQDRRGISMHCVIRSGLMHLADEGCEAAQKALDLGKF